MLSWVADDDLIGECVYSLVVRAVAGQTVFRTPVGKHLVSGPGESDFGGFWRFLGLNLRFCGRFRAR